MVSKDTIRVLFGVFALLCAQSHGFTVPVINVHSPNSPSYNPSRSRAEHPREALLPSQSRAVRMKRRAATTTPGLPATAKFATDVEYALGYYAVKISIGTPPVEMFAALDTGSDLTWIQCKPCEGTCFPQDLPLFDPSMSSSYARVPCDSPICLEGGWYSCDTSTNLCHYDYGYMDASYTHGDVAHDTLALGDTSFPNFVFGCGFNNSRAFSHMTTGIFGLSNSRYSFIQQAKIERFMYCLPRYLEANNVSTHIAFNSDAVFADPDGVFSTPMVGPESDDLYWVTLENFSVGGKTVLPKPLNESTGRVMIDSGTTFTYLPDELHEALITELKSVVKSTPVSDPGATFKLCYNESDIAAEVFPAVAAHFAGGAVVQLSPKVLLSYYVVDGVVCLPLSNGGSVWGFHSQIDNIILYDLVARSISFKSFDCNHF